MAISLKTSYPDRATATVDEASAGLLLVEGR
jgi:hypothetical protein